MASTLYAQVIVPLPMENTFTYRVPATLADSISQGSRVIIQFGAKRFYTGIVTGISPVPPPPDVMVKDIVLSLDTTPVVRPWQIRFWEWMSSYYLCTIGEVYRAAVPAGLKIESETQLSVEPDMQPAMLEGLSDEDFQILENVRRKKRATVRELAGGDKDVQARLERLIDCGALIVSEKLVERYKVANKPYVRLAIAKGDSQAVSAAFAAVARSARQEQTLVALMALSDYNRRDAPEVEVPLEVLLSRAATDRATVKALEKKGLCKIYNKAISRFSYSGPGGGSLPVLSQAQQNALGEIHTSFRTHDVVLLHGVTSSGKTEVYIHLIDYVLHQGRQVLMLVPEIALTTQLTTRLQRVFGAKVLIYHSKFTDSERVELWRTILSTKEPLVVLGARSAVFLPFSSLGLVIVDEEHEPSYKQYDPAPRYNGRDAATVLAAMHGAKTLFGSATPAVETYYKAQSGKFGLVTLSERYAGAQLPPMEIVDMRPLSRGHKEPPAFSTRLLEATEKAISAGRQAIFFLNRRGYAPVARCSVCGFTSKCDHCDVSLTYHKRKHLLQCHYCGCEYPVPQLCPQCGEPAMEISGYGTERLEDEISVAFKERRILRMDLDTTRNKEGYSRIIDEFSAGNADILVGTQMVAKGLDFGGVEVVGVLNADALLNIPDFRSAERAFNMIEQVSGRAGRRAGGLVVIQTFNPRQPVLAFAAAHDYTGFYNYELEQRRQFGYPPFCRVVNIFLKHRDAKVVAECATAYAARLRAVLGDRVHGPQEPPVARVQAMYIRRIMLKVENKVSMARVKEILRQEYISQQASPLMRGLSLHYDVDPV